jgi:hypothetical protein
VGSRTRIRRTGIAVVGKPAGRLSFGVRDERDHRVVAPGRQEVTDQVSSATRAHQPSLRVWRAANSQNAG